MAQPTKTKLTMQCAYCGSTEVRRDAPVEWNVDAQAWVLAGDPYDDGQCINENCGAEGGSVIEMIEEQVPYIPGA